MCNTKVNKENKTDRKKYFSIGKAAKEAHTTTETLRHYDRIGLVKPSKKDDWTNYRYYSEQDIVRLNTVRVLQIMDISLAEIKKVLSYNDLEKIISFLEETEKKADEKIEALNYSKKKIQLAKADYISKLKQQQNLNKSASIKEFDERVILLSDALESPTLDNLWNYLSHFYEKIGPELKDDFYFEDLAGIYSDDKITRLFALCTRYTDTKGIKILPKGKYLCTNCKEDEREEMIRKLMQTAKTEYGVEHSFNVQIIVISGILHWNYEIQVYIS